MKKLNNPEMLELISELGKKWRDSEENPSHSAELLEHWERIVYAWKDDHELPLVIRKHSESRGQERIHKTGRKIVLTDNSFSQWIFYNILNNEQKYSLSELKLLIADDKIPFSFAIKKTDLSKVKYKTPLGKFCINKDGWKLCHIEPVGLKSPLRVEEMDIERLQDHFVKLANPKNMFVLPLEIGGLGEIDEFIKEQKYNH